MTWILGGNRAAAEAVDANEMPAIFGWASSSHKSPGAAILTGTISSSIMVIYGFMASNLEYLFWTLFSFSAIIFLLPCIAMHLAFLKLRMVVIWLLTG